MSIEAGNIVIRTACVEDTRVLLQLIRELAAYEKLSADVIATEESLKATLFGARPHAYALLAFYEDQPAGFAVYFFAYSTFMAKSVLYLEDLFVREKLRGKGIGKELFNAVLKVGNTENCGRVDWSVLEWNQPAIEFYERLGARAQRQWVKFSLPARP